MPLTILHSAPGDKEARICNVPSPNQPSGWRRAPLGSEVPREAPGMSLDGSLQHSCYFHDSYINAALGPQFITLPDCLSAQRLLSEGYNFLTLMHDKVSLKGWNKVTLGGWHWEVTDMTWSAGTFRSGQIRESSDESLVLITLTQPSCDLQLLDAWPRSGFSGGQSGSSV